MSNQVQNFQNSTAPVTRPLFAQQCADGMCHISFAPLNETIDSGKPLNIQIPRWDLKRFIANLIRVDKALDEVIPLNEQEQHYEKVIWMPDKKPY